MSVLKYPHKTNHTLIALTDLEVLRLNDMAYDKAMKMVKYNDKEKIEDLFKTVPGFNEIDESKIR